MMITRATDASTTAPLTKSRDIFVAAEKRSITIAGHATSIRIESPFWDALVQEADSLGLPVSAIVARIDAERLAVPDPPNLASAIRLWLFSRAQPLDLSAQVLDSAG